KFFLDSFILNISERCCAWIHFYAFAFQLFERFYIYSFDFKSKYIHLFSEVINGIKIHQIALLKIICGNAAGSFGAWVEDAGADVPFTGFVEHHFAQLPTAENAEGEIGGKVVHIS